MKQFLDEDFLLNSETAKTLYHEYACKMPIYDYHCHLSIKDIYEDRKFDSITDLWLVEGKSGDHYKWRAMRNFGVEEKYITGDASKKEKFDKWAETIPYTLGNPLYHWTHLELKRYFDFDGNFGPKVADQLYESMNKKLETLTARKIIESSNVDSLCTTDDPLDDLHYHQLLREDKSFKVHVYPAWRPDKIVNCDLDTYVDYVKKLSAVVGYEIKDLTTLEKALTERINYFHENQCRLSDHSLEVVQYEDATDEEVNEITIKAIKGEKLSTSEVAKYKGHLMVFFGRNYARLGWVQQYHIKALRNNSTRMFKEIGPDIGYDSINDGNIAAPISAMLNKLDSTNELPKTIVYSLNPADQDLLGSIVFCFGEGKVPGKMQLGSAWWFLDNKSGMEKQLQALANLGLLSKFVGMLTDSRSLLSYTRHEYFRRVLCNVIGTWIENGEYPNDIEFVGKIVQDICFNNAKAYFDTNR